ncbi:MAG: YhjD/YihY/BrkB family envelope integrity protein [Verrucomicrobiota bacterium]
MLALVPLLAVAVSVSAGLLKSQRQESVQDWIRAAIIRVAPILGLKQAGNESTIFSTSDIEDTSLDSMISRLETGLNPVSRYLWDTRFSAESKAQLTNHLAVASEKRKQILVDEFNKVIRGENIYDPQRFARVRSISPKTLALLSQNPSGEELAQLNHQLLADTYRIGEDALDTVTSQITSFVSNFQSGKLGVSAVLALIFVAISLLATVEATFNDIWGVTRGRGWFSRVVQYWAALTLGPMFLVSALTLTTWAKVSQRVVEQIPVVRLMIPFLAPLIILSIGCALLYLVMPNTKVPWRAALLGGLTAGALLQLNSYFNVLYVSRVLTYKQIYGSMAALPLFLLGLYFSWLLVLLGAQVTYAFQNRQAYVQEKKAESINPRGRDFVAVRLMGEVAERFQCGQSPPNDCAMAERLKVPLRLVSQVICALVQAGLVLEVAGTESGYAPARPLAQITLRDVLLAVRVGQGQDLPASDDMIQTTIRKEFEAIELSWEQAAAAITLEELVQRLNAAAQVAVAATPAREFTPPQAAVSPG